MHVRHHRSIIASAAALVAGALGACGAPGMHPGEVPLAPDPIGTPYIAGSDTSFVDTEPGYALVARSYRAIWDTKYAVDDAAMDFRRLFGIDPPRVVVVVRDSAGAPLVPPALAQRPTVTLALGRQIRSYSRAPQSGGMGPERGGMAEPIGNGAGIERRVSSLTARSWLSALADSLAGKPVTSDTTRARFAPWFSQGAATLLASPDAGQAAVASVRQRGRDIVPLASLFSATSPSGPLFGSQSASVVAFLADRGGPTTITSIASALARGTSMTDALAHLDAKAPISRDVTQLEADWRRWVDARGGVAPQRADRRRGG